MSPLSTKNAGQTGLNRTTHAVSSTSTWYAFAGQVTLTLHFFQDPLYVSRCGFLPLREVFEGLKELPHDCPAPEP